MRARGSQRIRGHRGQLQRRTLLSGRFRSDKAEAFCCVEPFDGAVSHVNFPYQSAARGSATAVAWSVLGRRTVSR